MSFKNIEDRILRPVKSDLNKYISVYKYNELKERKSNLITTTLFFSIREGLSFTENLNIFKNYLNSVQKLINQTIKLRSWDFRIYLDFNSIYTLTKKGEDILINFINKNKNIDIYMYRIKLLYRDQDLLNEGTVGTIIRYLPLFPTSRDGYNLVYITDADEKSDILKENAEIGESIKKNSIYKTFYNTSGGYNRKLHVAENLKYPIISDCFITSLTFSEQLLISYFDDYSNNKLDTSIKRLVNNSKKSMHSRRTYYRSLDKLQIFPYGMDELFLNYYLLRELIVRREQALIKISNNPMPILKSSYKDNPSLLKNDEVSFLFKTKYEKITTKDKIKLHNIVEKILPKITGISHKFLSNYLKSYKPTDDWNTYRLIKLYSNDLLTTKLANSNILDINSIKNAKYTVTTEPITVASLLNKDAKNIMTICIDKYYLNMVKSYNDYNYIIDLIRVLAMFLSLSYSNIYLRIYIDQELSASKQLIKIIYQIDNKTDNIEIYIYKLNGVSKRYHPKFISHLMVLHPIFNFKENKKVEWVFPRDIRIINKDNFNELFLSRTEYKKAINFVMNGNSKYNSIFFTENIAFRSMYNPDNKYVNADFYQPYFMSGVSKKFDHVIFNNFINNLLTENIRSKDMEIVYHKVTSDKFKQSDRYGVNNSFPFLYAGVEYVLWLNILNKLYNSNKSSIKIHKIKPGYKHIINLIANKAFGTIVNDSNLVKDIILDLNQLYQLIVEGKSIKQQLNQFRNRYSRYFDKRYQTIIDQLESKELPYNYILL